MKKPTEPQWMIEARARGWMDAANKGDAAEEPSPWLIAVLMVGALFCTAPLLGLMVAVMGDLLIEAGYVVSMVLLIGSVALLHAPRPLFVQCLCVVGIAAGATWLGVSLVSGSRFRGDEQFQLLAWLQAGLMLGCATFVRPRWVLQLLGMVFTAWLLVALQLLFTEMDARWLISMHGAAAMLAVAWCVFTWHEADALGHRDAVRWCTFADGAAVGLLLGVCVVAQIGQWLHLSERPPWAWLAWVLPCLLVLFAGVALIRRWRTQTSDTRWQSLLWLAVILLAAASAAMPSLAPVAIIAAAVAATARWRLLALCALVALVCVSRFYYDLSLPLATKGLGMAAAGFVLLLALLVWRAAQRHDSGQATAAHAPVSNPWRWVTAAVALGAALCFGLVNWDVWRKEAVVAHGEVILVPLAPVDPRSLMQGDYMALRFDIPTPVMAALANLADRAVRTHALVVMQLNDKQQAKIVRLAQPKEALAVNERLMPLKRLKGNWALVTDAYFFPEGQGKPFEAARFGEFRVLPDGRALLIGLSAADGTPIRSPHDLRD